MQGLVFLNRLARAPALLKFRHLARGSAAKTQQSRAEGKSHRQLLLATP
jgi:hypothetical protein